MYAIGRYRYPNQTRILKTYNNMSTTRRKVVSIDNMNPYIKNMIHSIRNEIFDKAADLEKDLQKKFHDISFRKVIRADLLDPQAVNSNYVTYGRQILALLCYRPLFTDENLPKDVKERAHLLQKFLRFGSVGSSGSSNGVDIVRRHVASYIAARDKVTTNPHDIFLCSGITDSFRTFVKMLNQKINGKIPAILLPNPHHPVYSALTQAYGMTVATYNLDESKNWEVDMNHLKNTITYIRQSCNPRALVIMNPDTITGNVLTLNCLKNIIKFAHQERLILIADETYHNNIYTENYKFHSVRKVQRILGKSYKDMEIASLMSVSDGWFGECGIRAGYIELANFNLDIKESYFNCLRLTRSPNILGQMVLDSVVNPPLEGNESYKSYMKQKTGINETLKEKGEMVTHGLNLIKGVTCNPIRGGICVFPRFEFPLKALDKAAEFQKTPDEYFAMELLKSKGVSLIPGSVVECPQGSYHLCMTILPHFNDIRTMLTIIKDFYYTFCKKHT